VTALGHVRINRSGQHPLLKAKADIVCRAHEATGIHSIAQQCRGESGEPLARDKNVVERRRSASL
jgi:hypothetical protein